MAWPTLPGVLAASVILHGLSGFPEDVFVNTLYFKASTGDIFTDNEKDLLATSVSSMWTSSLQLSTPLREFISDVVDKTANKAEVRVYDLGVPPGSRVPFIKLWGLGGTAGNQSLPSEISLCLSFYASLNRPWTRGRIYAGPFTENASETDPTTKEARPSAALIDSLVQIGVALQAPILIDAGAGRTVVWHQVGKTGPKASTYTSRQVTAGWVDNAWDTQRRRGLDASVRTPIV